MSKKQLRPWKTLRKETILDHGKFLQVENHVIELPDGQVIDNWAWVKIPDAAIVLAQDTSGRFLCFQQIKYAVDGVSLAPVGGMLEPGEDPLEAGKRELLEEMGYEAEEWISLGSHILDPNRGVATMHLFFARGAQKVAEPDSDDLEDQELIYLSQAELNTALHEGEFKIISWSAVVSMALGYIRTEL